MPHFKFYPLYIILVSCTTLCFGQNAGESGVFVLRNKQVIDDVKIWKVHPFRIEYEKQKNLHDIETKSVLRFDLTYSFLMFEADTLWKKYNYDMVIVNTGDTLFGIIQNNNKNTLDLIPRYKSKSFTVNKEDIKHIHLRSNHMIATNKN